MCFQECHSISYLPRHLVARCILFSLPHIKKAMEVAVVVPFLDVTRVLATSFSVSLMM